MPQSVPRDGELRSQQSPPGGTLQGDLDLSPGSTLQRDLDCVEKPEKELEHLGRGAKGKGEILGH